MLIDLMLRKFFDTVLIGRLWLLRQQIVQAALQCAFLGDDDCVKLT